jgi:RNA polymerase sigma factor (sigma-70 family)
MEMTDADLVTQCLAGRREAFERIVARYQSLISSLAYSATGSISQSQDLAQETFVIAWKQLSELREPEKLRSWLCGILKNRLYKAFRKQGREPVYAAEPLESVEEMHSAELPPSDQAITREEEIILWRSVEKIPEIYREPLILFYREHQSIETVAAHLELSEDAVKQRLSRGRKLLQERMLAFVEITLERTNPGKAFTMSVMSVLPVLTLSSKAAALGTMAVKSGVTAKLAGTMGLLAAVISPVLGYVGMWMGYRATQDSARSEREREFNKVFFKRIVVCIAAFTLAYVALMVFGGSMVANNPALFVSLTLVIALSYISAIGFYSVKCYYDRKSLLASLTPAEIATNPTRPIWEYRSRAQLFGLPLVHFRIGDRLGEPVKAWIAGGDCAFGLLFAFGGCAIAPISVGGCAVGLLSYGGCAIGIMVLGGMGFGWWAFGGLAVGWEAYGGCAIALNAAWGGYAVAHNIALGGVAHAFQANTALAQQLSASSPFYRACQKAIQYVLWSNLVWFIPLIIQRRLIKRARLQGQKA